MRSFRLLAVAVLGVILALSSAQNAFAATELAYDSGNWFDVHALDAGDSLAVRFVLSDFVPWSQAKIVRVAFYIYSGTDVFRVHIRGNLGTNCNGVDVMTFDVAPYTSENWNYYDVSGNAVVSGEFCVVAEWLTSSSPSFGLSRNLAPPFGSGHSYRYQSGLWYHDTDYDDMIRAYADPVAVPVGGVVMPANAFALLSPSLAVIAATGFIATIVVMARKRFAS
jgi:hypothetical protein